MLAFPKGLTLDVTAEDKVIGAYWAVNGVGSAGSVAGLDLTMASAPKPISLAAEGLVSPEGIALQGGNLFFTDFGGNAVYAMDLGTKSASLLAGPGNGAAQSGAYRVAADTARVYWTNEAMPGSVVMVDRADPVPIVVASNQGTPRHLALDGAPATALFWTNYGSGEVMTASIDAGTPPTAGTPVALFSGQNKPYGIVVDGETIYWTNNGDGTVMKAPKAGGTPEKIASDQHSPGAIAVDENNVYWINEGSLTKADGAVMRLAKKP
jgi:sugar lactone lactonase YvrE